VRTDPPLCSASRPPAGLGPNRRTGRYACPTSTDKELRHVSVRAMTGRCGHTRHLARLSDTRPMCHQALSRLWRLRPLALRFWTMASLWRPAGSYLMLRVPPFTMTARLRMVACQRETGRVQSRHGAHHTLLLPGLAHPFSLAKHGMRATPARRACGAPGALKGARRVREAARRNGSAGRPEPRSGPTSHPRQRRDACLHRRSPGLADRGATARLRP
jgi:hypothetical protein